MSINVYWSTLGPEWLRATEPELLFPKIVSKFYKEKDETLDGMFQCPAITSAYKNVYSLRSIYDYNIRLDKETGRVSSSKYDQNFFDRQILIRSSKNRLLSFVNQNIFFTEEKSLKLTACIPAVYEDNDIAQNTFLVSGEYDIGKWFRSLDFAFFINENVDSINIKYGDIFSYIKFHTDQKIKFHKFAMTPKLSFFSESCGSTTRYRNIQKWKLADFYSLFHKNMKKNILKEIKENLV